MQDLSDKAIAVFAFAAYHQLATGQRVSSVVQRDEAGHQAEEQALNELDSRGLARADGRTIHFTQEGERLLQAFIEGMRQTIQTC